MGRNTWAEKLQALLLSNCTLRHLVLMAVAHMTCYQHFISKTSTANAVRSKSGPCALCVGPRRKFAGSESFFIKLRGSDRKQAGSDQQKSRIRPATTPDRTRRTRPNQTNGTSDQTQDSPDLRATSGSVANQSFRGPKHDSGPSKRGFGWSAVINTPRLEGFPRKQHQFLAKAPGTTRFQTHQKTPLTPQNMISSPQKSVLDGSLPSRP